MVVEQAIQVDCSHVLVNVKGINPIFSLFSFLFFHTDTHRKTHTHTEFTIESNTLAEPVEKKQQLIIISKATFTNN